MFNILLLDYFNRNAFNNITFVTAMLNSGTYRDYYKLRVTS